VYEDVDPTRDYFTARVPSASTAFVECPLRMKVKVPRSTSDIYDLYRIFSYRINSSDLARRQNFHWISDPKKLVLMRKCCRYIVFSCCGFHITIKIKILGYECQTSGTYAKRAKQATKIDNCLCFLNYLAFLRPVADRAVSILPWVVSPGRSYGFLWAGSIIQKKCEKGRSNSGLFASKRSKMSHGACWSPLGAKSASTDAPN
jgi:hypothetical protein